MISVGLVGCGAIAESGHVPALVAHPQFRPVAVCDVFRQRAELLAKQAGGGAAYTDWRELIHQETLDAVVLALPPGESPTVVAECLERGLAVLDEKPLAANVAEGRRLAERIRQSGGVYQIGFVLRYGDWVQALGRLAPKLGSPLKIRAEIYDEQLDPADAEHLGRIQGFLKNSSAMTHEGSHVIDYVSLWNASPWTRVHSTAERTDNSLAGPNVWNAKIDLADDSELHVKIAWLLPALPQSFIELEGPAGRLHFNFATGEGSCDVGTDHWSLSLDPLAPQWKRQYDTFAAAIERGHAEIASVLDGLRALEVTAACEVSARLGRAVTPGDIIDTTGVQRIDPEHGLLGPSKPQAKPSKKRI